MLKNFKKKVFLVDSDKVTEVVSLTSKILKILYYVMLVGVIFLAIKVCQELEVLGFVLKLLNILSPLFIGFVIAWIFNPAVTYLHQKGLSRILATTIVYILLLAFVFLFMSLLIPMLYDQINDLINALPTIFGDVKDFISNFFDNFNKIEGLDVVKMKQNVILSLETFVNNISVGLPNTLINTISSLFSGIGVFLISLIVGFYMLFNFDSTNDHMLSLLPKKYRYETRVLIEEISTQLRKYVKGVLILSGVICLTCTLGFWIVGLEAPLLFGLFCGVTNIIPYVGPYLGAAPAVLVGFSQSPQIGILTLVIVAVIQTLEGNFFQPIIMSKTMKLHPVTIMLGLIVFGYFFGMWGMILATPILALCKILSSYFINKYDLFDYDDEPTEVIEIGEVKKESKK